MVRSSRGPGPPAPRSHARKVRRRAPRGAERQLEVPLPPALKHDAALERASVALVDVRGDVLRLRFVGPGMAPDDPAALSAPEADALARGGVGRVTERERRLAEARSAAAFERLRGSSLTVESAARRLGVNASRIRQRLAEGSLYGMKHGSQWLLPSFQFRKDGVVPGLDVVVKRLPRDIGALAVARWFGTPNPDLCARDDERPQTPLQWLLGGNPPDAAAELAAAL
jgi:hypothetical protein